MTAFVDLEQRLWVRTRAEISIIGTYLHDGESHKPCMVLIREGEEKNEHTVPCIVTADKAWIWSEEIGDPRQAARQAFGFAQALRLGEQPKTIIFVASLIHDHLSDLLHIPPYVARNDGEALAELTITNRSTGATTEVTLRDV